MVFFKIYLGNLQAYSQSLRSGFNKKDEPCATVANRRLKERRVLKLVASLRLIGASRINASEHFGLGHLRQLVVAVQANAFAGGGHAHLKIFFFLFALLSNRADRVLDSVENTGAKVEWRLSNCLATVNCEWVVYVFQKADIESFRDIVESCPTKYKRENMFRLENKSMAKSIRAETYLESCRYRDL
jgi:hypothetical protein